MVYVIKLEDGKYEFINHGGSVIILRNGEEWRDETGDKALLSLLQQMEQHERKIERYEEHLRWQANMGNKWALDLLDGNRS